MRTLIDLAKSFGITTVGEWVGDEKTARLLEKAGVSYMQGYFFGAPELTKEKSRPRGRPPNKPLQPASRAASAISSTSWMPASSRWRTVFRT